MDVHPPKNCIFIGIDPYPYIYTYITYTAKHRSFFGVPQWRSQRLRHVSSSRWIGGNKIRHVEWFTMVYLPTGRENVRCFCMLFLSCGKPGKPWKFMENSRRSSVSGTHRKPVPNELSLVAIGPYRTIIPRIGSVVPPPFRFSQIVYQRCKWVN